MTHQTTFAHAEFAAKKKLTRREQFPKKGNRWYFGLKAHIGTDRDGKPVHTMVATAANVADITKPFELRHGEETQGHADAGYTGVEKRPEIVALGRKLDRQIAGKRGAIKAVEHAKAAVRAFVEHPFHLVQNLFRHRKVRYRGLTENGHQLHVLFGLANVVIAARRVAARVSGARPPAARKRPPPRAP